MLLSPPAVVSSHRLAGHRHWSPWAGRTGWFLKSIGSLVLFMTVVSLVDSSTASAQGLFGRMRARIEARLQAVPSPALPNPASPNLNAPNPAIGPPAVPVPPGRTPNSPRVLASPLGDALLPADAAGASSDAEGSTDQPTFGIDVTPAQVGRYRGLRVIGFQPNSRAPEAGLQLGDLIVSVEGRATRSLADVPRSITASSIARQAELQVMRDGRLYRTTVPVIASRPDASSRTAAKPAVTPATGNPATGNPAAGPTLARPRSSLGLEVRNAAPQRGIEVVVAPEGTAGVIGGLKPQDRIVSVDGRLTKDIDGLIRELSVTQPGESVRFGVVRGESMLELDIEMGGPGGKPIRGATEANVVAAVPGAVPADAGQTDDGQSEGKQDDGGSSILGGVGAALGGLFAPPRASANTPASEPKPATREPDTVADEPIDPLALPEDEAPQRDGAASLLPPPSGQADTSMSEVDRLRAEVERLQRQLNQK